MCGIVAILQGPHTSGSLDKIAEMTQALAHRGPDDQGVWLDRDAGIALGHRRLSVLDVSATGHQPMLSPDGRFVVTYNGEIYNHLSLRKKVEHETSFEHQWKGHSDTETLAVCLQVWGVEKTLSNITGMFAIVAWDRARRVLHLARDRIGEKPLYFGWAGTSLVVTSELKALWQLDEFDARISLDALRHFLRLAYVPCPLSIYDGVFKLYPGTHLKISTSQLDKVRGRIPRLATSNSPWSIRAYWSLQEAYGPGNGMLELADKEALDRLEQVLTNAVSQQLMADVPIGVFLSGGIDSSLIAAIGQTVNTAPLKTFSIGFAEQTHNEALDAGKIAKQLGTEHRELTVTADDALELVPQLHRIYDEPFGDSSQIPTILLSRFSREFVTVALTGDGGDELFGGYNRHYWAPRIWEALDRVPSPFRKAIGALSVHSASVVGQTYERWVKSFGHKARYVQLRDKLETLGESLKVAHSQESFYRSLASSWLNSECMSVMPADEDSETYRWPSEGSFAERMMLLDALTYLPDDILCKVDRASMSVGLETRAPFLDMHCVELAFRLPEHFKLRGGQTKWVLRQLLNKHLPDCFNDRPKRGFSVPIDDWLRGPLKEWCFSLLTDECSILNNIFDTEELLRTVKNHMSGRRNYGRHLWPVLMFLDWQRNSNQDKMFVCGPTG